MNYLNRPVFTFDFDWSSAIARTFSYDLRETSLGFGAEFYVPTETFTAQGWTFTVMLNTDVLIAAMDSFMDALFGRLIGFWLPAPLEAFRIAGGVSATQFDIVAQNLTATWQDRPDAQLWFTQADGSAPIGAMITAVTDNHNGTERVTVNANVTAVPGMLVRRLNYVRLAEDTEKASFVNEGWQDREFNVVELPTEYALLETGRQPIYLYHFSAPAPVLIDWYYTSFSAPVFSNGIEYQPFPMTHGQIQQTSRGDKDTVQIEAKPDSSHPLSLFFPEPFGAPMNISISSCQFGTPDDQTLMFSGIVRSVDDQGTKYVATCSSLLYLLDRKVPRMLIQPTCNYNLFDGPTCGILRVDFETTVTLQTINNGPGQPNVICQLLFPTLQPQLGDWQTANWFAGGIFETGYGLDYEPRTIVASSWSNITNLLTLTLNLPLADAQVGQFAQITAGCDGSVDACTNKFNNFNRFGGFIAVPQRNLTLEAFNNLPVSQGGKK